MRKQIKKYGNTAVIQINLEELNLYELKFGDIVEVELKKVKKK